MKPRILIAIHYMHLGGAEISLIGLLQALDPKKVDVDLFVYSHEDGNGVVAKAITITSVATALILGIATYAVCNKLEKKDSAVEEEIENKSIVTEAAVQVGVVDTLVQTEEAPAEAVAEEATVETTEEN